MGTTSVHLYLRDQRKRTRSLLIGDYRMSANFEEIYSFAPKWRELVTKKKQEYLDKNANLQLQTISIDIHNATWCLDCERETVELIALIELNSTTVEINIYSYEDLQSYKDKKKEGSLPVKSLPTFIMKSHNKEIARIEEDSNNKLLELLKGL